MAFKIRPKTAWNILRNPLRGSGGVTPGKILEIFDAKSRIWGKFGPENKLIEGQPNEYDVICRNASVLEFHLLPTIFAGAPFRLQNICRNGVPSRSRTMHYTPGVLMFNSCSFEFWHHFNWDTVTSTNSLKKIVCNRWRLTQSTTRSKLTSKPWPAKQVYSNAEFVRLAKHTQNSV